jgi:hypothetical protein
MESLLLTTNLSTKDLATMVHTRFHKITYRYTGTMS